MTLKNRKLGPYLLQETISVSDRATLYRAVNPKPGGGDFGIRILNSPDDHMDSRLLLHEYHSHNALRGRFTPQVVGIYRGEGALVYRWISGVSLDRVIEGHANAEIELNVKSVVEIVLQIATALHELHTHPEAQRPPIFGRINPEHVLLTRLGTIILLGMGRQLYNSDKQYRSPEQAAVAFVDWRSDQWSLGALTVELLLQEKLYNNRSDLQSALLKGDVRHWTEAIKLRWPILGKIVSKMLAANAGDRYTDERSLIQDLRNLHQNIDGRVRCRAICEKLIQYPIHNPTPPPKTVRPRLSTERLRRSAVSSTARSPNQDITEPFPITPTVSPRLKPSPKPTSSQPSQRSTPAPNRSKQAPEVTEKMPVAPDIEFDWDEDSDVEMSEWDMALPTAETPKEQDDLGPDFPDNGILKEEPVPQWLFALNAALLSIFSILVLIHLAQIFQNVFYS